MDEIHESRPSSTTYVVGLARSPAFQQREIRFDNVAGITEITGDFEIPDVKNRIAPAGFDLRDLSSQGGNEEAVDLTGTDVAEGARANDVQLPKTAARFRDRVGGSLREGIGTHRAKGRGLGDAASFGLWPVHLSRAHHQHACARSHAARGLEHGQRAEGIDLVRLDRL